MSDVSLMYEVAVTMKTMGLPDTAKRLEAAADRLKAQQARLEQSQARVVELNDILERLRKHLEYGVELIGKSL